ncbi:MAG TPA: right-handed parallel beta-helix repeat-containing protein [Solirubrobacteraceae bacterium]|nr:right-handed parallel beta-helix repeat-containing protein [Solirubrobacteraceae bacterium]
MTLNASRPFDAGRRLVLALCAALACSAFSAFTLAAPASAETSSCALYASPAGNNANPGSATAPLRTISALLARLSAGQTGCLASGQTFNEGVNIHSGESHGAEGAPVTLTSVDPSTPALINGRVVTHAGADWLTFTHLNFTFSEYLLPSITIGSTHTTWTYDDVTAPTTICFNLINSSTWGVAVNTVIEHDRIHGCGSQETFLCNQNIPLCETPPNDGFFIHAIYIGGGRNTIIRNDYLYNNADRAVQMRSGAEGVIVEHNIMDADGEGVIFGDGATGATVQWNIITGSHSKCGELSGCYDYGASEYNAAGSNLFAHNDVYGNQCANPVPACWPNAGNIEKMSHVTVEKNVEVAPLYVDAGAGNYALQASSPVLGYGPDAVQPEATSGSGTVTEVPSPTPVTESSGHTKHGGSKKGAARVASSVRRRSAPRRTSHHRRRRHRRRHHHHKRALSHRH